MASHLSRTVTSTPTNIPRRRFLAAGAVLAGTALLPGRKFASAAGPGVHPYAAAQPTDNGKRLWPLYAYAGRIYSGYGDYGANTGPMHIMSADPTTLEWTDHHVLESEAIAQFRSFSDGLYVPSVDPRGLLGDDYATNASGSWASIKGINPTHAYDMAERVPGELWITGSQGVDAVAWKRVNGTWEEAWRKPPPADLNVAPWGYTRSYFIISLAGSIYLQAFPGPAWPGTEPSDRWDGTSWSAGPDLNLGYVWNPTPWNGGVLLYQGGNGAPGGPLGFFNGRSIRWSDHTCSDYAITQSGVFALEAGGVVTNTTDLKKWAKVAQGPTTAVGLAVMGNTAFFGTSDSTIVTAPITIGRRRP